MRQSKIAGIYRRKGHGCTRRDSSDTPAEDLVKRQFKVAGPDRTDAGKVYLVSSSTPGAAGDRRLVDR